MAYSWDIEEPKLLQNLGCRLFGAAHNLTRTLAQIPKPILGTSLDKVENAMAPFVQPIVQAAEDNSLYVLSVFDHQLYIVGGAMDKCLQTAMTMATTPKRLASTFQASATKLQRRGVIGCTADVWADYEYTVRKKSQEIMYLLQGIPGITLISTPLLYITGGTLGAASAWLLEHSAAKEKHLISTCEVISEDGDEGGDHEEHGSYDGITEVEEHPYVEAKVEDEAPVIVENPGHDLAKGKLLDGKKAKYEEQDDLTKLLDAGWGLRTV